jgi:hypothetical protein
VEGLGLAAPRLQPSGERRWGSNPGPGKDGDRVRVHDLRAAALLDHAEDTRVSGVVS